MYIVSVDKITEENTMVGYDEKRDIQRWLISGYVWVVSVNIDEQYVSYGVANGYDKEIEENGGFWYLELWASAMGFSYLNSLTDICLQKEYPLGQINPSVNIVNGIRRVKLGIEGTGITLLGNGDNTIEHFNGR
jgi:hypothetical protein